MEDHFGGNGDVGIQCIIRIYYIGSSKYIESWRKREKERQTEKVQCMSGM